ncbi:MAG: hypothetical protein IJG33_16295 [Selenomonadaceae bacterium]|nr:hypothetical protein [Selenomonadaceae bacterium]
MAVQDKFADEKLSDEELDQVAGGTVGEYDELRDLFGTVKRHVSSGGRNAHTFEGRLNDEEIKSWLRSNLNIDAQINYKRWFPWQDGDPNVYTRNGQSLTHEQVVKEIKAKLG